MRTLFFFITMLMSLYANSLEEKQLGAGRPEVAENQVIFELYHQIESLKQASGSLSGDQLQQLTKLESEFEKLLVGEEIVNLYSGEAPQASLEDELTNLLQPVFGAIKSTTASLREKEDLRAASDRLAIKQQASQESVAKINTFLSSYKDSSPNLEKDLSKLLKTYQTRLKLAEAQKADIDAKLAALESEEVNPMESISEQVGSFIRSTGMHLVVAFLLALFIFLGVNYAFKKLLTYSKKHTGNAWYFNYEYLATIDGAVFVGSIIFSIFIIPLVFLIFGNWFLISVFALVGLITFWMTKDQMSALIEEIRLILNIGAVREQERVIYNGLPWVVEEIKFYSRLKNPLLDGGRLRIPLKELVGMTSRAFKPNEAYFPTKKGDWVLLPDEEVGEITQQTIEYISLKQLGGSVKTIPTASFLEMSPVNLTENGFRVSVMFGIDYNYQKDATTKIERLLEEFIQKELLEELDQPEHLKNFFIEFASASASSLDYEINAEFTGEVAELYKEIPCYLQRFAVNACNEYGWEIPFTQIQIHQA